ncbi:MAG: sulfatase-like hydrolase/transferase [Fimbriimonadaceae bacterium]|nr:sulfatase-like hydrolase/transferase [Fimbriimonadaceae bacterium]
MDRRTFLGTCGASAALAAGAARAQAPARPPNIVLFYADDLDFDEVPGWDMLRVPCYTAAAHAKDPAVAPPKLHLPHFERLLREGQAMDRCYISSPVCTPARYSILTGRQAQRSTWFRRSNPDSGPANIMWNTHLDASESNIAKALGALGYRTGIVGKWHNGLPGGEVRGVAELTDPRDPRVTAACQEAQARRARYLTTQIGWTWAARIHHGNKEEEKIPAALKVHNLGWLADGAVEFLTQRDPRPFFLYLPVTIPHAQYFPGLLKDDPCASVGGWLAAEPHSTPPKSTVAARATAAGVAPRNHAGTWLDDCLGAVLRTLDETGQAEHTVVVVIGDHQSRGKYTCTEAARTPAVVRWPGRVAPGSRNATLMANLDLPATFCEIAGGQAPEDMRTDGRSLVESWTTGRTPAGWRSELLLSITTCRAVVSERWKYIAGRPDEAIRGKLQADAAAAQAAGRARTIDWSGHATDRPRADGGGVRYNADLDFPAYFDADQLYDLQADFLEQRNLAADPAYAATLRQQQELLRHQLASLPHPFGEFKTA